MDFVIIGAQKAATTWLTHALNAHHDIYLPKDEIPIFEDDCDNEAYFYGIEKMYQEEAEDKIQGIKNTHLMFYDESPGLICSKYPNIKIIVALRNPIERLVSSYYWHMRVGSVPLMEINEGVERILNLGSQSKDWCTIFEPGFYSKQIKHYYKYFKQEQFHFILHDDIKMNSMGVLEGLFEFVGVDAEVNLIDKNINNSKPKEAIYPLSRIKWLKLRNSLILYNSVDGRRVLWKDISEQKVHKRFINAFVVGVDRLIWSIIIGNKKPVLSDEIKRRIRDVYINDINELDALIGRRIPNW